MNQFQRGVQIGLIISKKVGDKVYDEHFDLLTNEECEGFMTCLNAYKEKLQELIDAT